ncbi:hypothetical protein EC973_002279 [Apophysomyces ossiformis]|uniref:CCHC-type domain-containing protein n=1 Tax=Apophysomyces ossiformis TaxID=679940 RepID=A0A8H7BNX1_9FUNG|nr:hypothetical protein EC973_002279 [Apophysomyces ossiformis]
MALMLVFFLLTIVVGHFADVCPEPERLCYNCKQPGHESNECSRPKSVDAKQCYACGGVGHIQASCPTAHGPGGGARPKGRCYNCGQFVGLLDKPVDKLSEKQGHIARNCNQIHFSTLPRGGGGGNGGFRPRFAQGGGGGFVGGRVICYKCGGYNHFARDCQANSVKCYNCGKFGHISRDCPSASHGGIDKSVKTCYRCGEQGHISRDCPSARSNGKTTAVPRVVDEEDEEGEEDDSSIVSSASD